MREKLVLGLMALYLVGAVAADVSALEPAVATTPAADGSAAAALSLQAQLGRRIFFDPTLSA